MGNASNIWCPATINVDAGDSRLLMSRQSRTEVLYPDMDEALDELFGNSVTQSQS